MLNIIKKGNSVTITFEGSMSGVTLVKLSLKKA